MPPSKYASISLHGFLIVLASAVMFGVGPNAIRAVYADGGNAMFSMLVMTWARGLGLGLFCVIRRIPLFENKEASRQSILGGLGQAVTVIGLYVALVYLPGPIVIIILFTHTLMLLFYSAWREQIKIDVAVVSTTILALIGLTFVLNLWSVQPPHAWLGYACAIVASIATAFRLYIYGHQTRSRHPISLGSENFLVAGLVITCLALFLPPALPVSAEGYIYAAVATVTTVLSSFGMFYGIAMLGAFQYSLFLKMEPIFTAIFAVFILNETLQHSQYMGMAIVITSLAAYQIMNYRKPDYAPSSP